MYVFIVNPQAGNGRGKKVFSKIKKSRYYKQIESTYYYTEYAGHTTHIVKKLSRESTIKAFIIIGGDGTIHEAINGLGSRNIPIAFIPGGSGNDFARGLGIKGNPVTILKEIVQHHSILSYWVGNYTLDSSIEGKYVNSVGIGFDAQIVHTANKSFYKRVLNSVGLGTLTYVIALIHVLLHFRPMRIEMDIDHKKRTLTNCWMITTANHPYYGGGMKIIPTAKIQPNTFPILIIHNISKWKVLALFLTVFTGKHVNFKEVEILEATKLSITTDEKSYIQVDGEAKFSKIITIKKLSEPISTIATKSKQIV
ncbi:diacylglycerol/lipid kinase family protein [Oceanobacillus bengalensis]|uniref:Diacylglycerol kinase family lipid kinase n=1 Tax=Oceanobacillus bengalensis TaxID=1435466 RepID=A0A494YWD4_9BACI|nr:diacylglycerol kinase family protein [Oceanobacillus bengalensis]RKQ14535.1 diacylglycerol kinase family lipid kinase [Oceanobacillus bengalensis]